MRVLQIALSLGVLALLLGAGGTASAQLSLLEESV